MPVVGDNQKRGKIMKDASEIKVYDGESLAAAETAHAELIRILQAITKAA